MIKEKIVWDVLKSPIVTEKSVILKEQTSGEDQEQVLTFKVDRKSNKGDIKKAVEEIFNVKVKQVRTIQYLGKTKKRGRFEGRRASWKKAYVTLQKGQPLVDYGEAI